MTKTTLPGLQTPIPLISALLALVGGAVFLAAEISDRQAGLFLIGALGGLTLYHASFGFAAPWRRFIVERRARAIRVQMLMLAVAITLFLPLLSGMISTGRPLVGAVAPVGVSVLFGAALFGFGMQLGGGCGSGTLFTVGGGSRRMLVVLAFFILGALIGTAHLPWWLGFATLPSRPLYDVFGLLPTWSVSLIALASIAGLASWLEVRRHGGLEETAPAPHRGFRRLLAGPWPLVGGAMMLVLVNLLTLLVAGHPWSITFAFGLWGAKIAAAAGVEVGQWSFWSAPAMTMTLNRSVLADVTSVMDFGLVLGAMLAASLAGKFAPPAKLPWRSLLGAAIGGMLMGYGARLSFGCNIGALFSGIASGSLHGWVWMMMAFLGSIVGVWIRPWFEREAR